MANQEKKLLHDTVAQLDANKKVNLHDLSSDQDLTIALMNLIAIEKMCPDTDIGNMVADIRMNLMQRVVTKEKYLKQSYELLGQSMRLFDDGIKAMKDGASKQAYDLFDRSYESYVVFWGINMGLIKLE